MMDKSIYQLPNNMNHFGISWLAIFSGVISIFFTSQIATQYLAHVFLYGGFLSGAILAFDGFSIYHPFAWVIWSWQLKGYGGQVEHHFIIAHIIVTLGSVASLVVTLCILYLKNKKRPYDFHGSARWAERDEIEATGLLGKYENN